MDEVLLTGPEAAALCGVATSTIRSWHRRGRLPVSGLDEQGRPMYRQLDVARAEAATRRRAGRPD
jgi:DNA-binding transcriptional MerR regulator